MGMKIFYTLIFLAALAGPAHCREFSTTRETTMPLKTALHPEKLARTVNGMWLSEAGKESSIIKALRQFVAIPNLSPAFASGDEWAENMDKAMDLLVMFVESFKKEWASAGAADDVTVTVYGGKNNPLADEENGGRRRTPALLVEIPAFAGKGKAADQNLDCVLLYGHMDKQPVGEGWSPGLDPRRAVIRDDKMYGRGAADDGYALFAALSSIMALRAQNIAHKRCFILIESAEESGSVDLNFHLDSFRERLGEVSLIVCLDSGAGDYQRLWLTDSLRGLLNGVLEVRVLTAAVHSGASSGIVPSPFRIMRQLLSRLEDERDGAIRPERLRVDIPDLYLRRAEHSAAILGAGVYNAFPFLDAFVRPADEDPAELLLNRTWRAALSVTGMEGFPAVREAGNATLPFARAKLSLRLPPTLNAREAAAAVKDLLEKDPPYGARVSFAPAAQGAGWTAPELRPWLAEALDEASVLYFNGNKPAFIGEGGSIDFMSELARRYPRAQFLVTGVLGPKSNAHGPDETLHLDAARRIAACVAHVLAAHAGAGE